MCNIIVKYFSHSILVYFFTSKGSTDARAPKYAPESKILYTAWTEFRISCQPRKPHMLFMKLCGAACCRVVLLGHDNLHSQSTGHGSNGTACHVIHSTVHSRYRPNSCNRFVCRMLYYRSLDFLYNIIGRSEISLSSSDLQIAHWENQNSNFPFWRNIYTKPLTLAIMNWVRDRPKSLFFWFRP